MNPYLPKVLENLGALVYEGTENEGQIYFNITSVVSSHGEQLLLKQVNTIWFLHSFVLLLFSYSKFHFQLVNVQYLHLDTLIRFGIIDNSVCVALC